jgi:hypothetical protein
VPQRHVPCCLHRAFSSTHKFLIGDGASSDMAMVEARHLFFV